MWQDYRFVAVLDPYELSEGGAPVRLDVGTGVCVRAREVGGPADEQGHGLVLLSVTD